MAASQQFNCVSWDGLLVEMVYLFSVGIETDYLELLERDSAKGKPT